MSSKLYFELKPWGKDSYGWVVCLTEEFGDILPNDDYKKLQCIEIARYSGFLDFTVNGLRNELRNRGAKIFPNPSEVAIFMDKDQGQAIIDDFLMPRLMAAIMRGAFN